MNFVLNSNLKSLHFIIKLVKVAVLFRVFPALPRLAFTVVIAIVFLHDFISFPDACLFEFKTAHSVLISFEANEAVEEEVIYGNKKQLFYVIS